MLVFPHPARLNCSKSHSSAASLSAFEFSLKIRASSAPSTLLEPRKLFSCFSVAAILSWERPVLANILRILRVITAVSLSALFDTQYSRHLLRSSAKCTNTALLLESAFANNSQYCSSSLTPCDDFGRKKNGRKIRMLPVRETKP